MQWFIDIQILFEKLFGCRINCAGATRQNRFLRFDVYPKIKKAKNSNLEEILGSSFFNRYNILTRTF